MSQITQSETSTPAARESRPADRTQASQSQTPVVNIHQDSDGYTLVVEMPGVAKSGVDVTFEDGKLALTGRREAPVTTATAVYREINIAPYRRVFDLDPSIDTQGITAGMEQGLLTIRLPRAEATKPRKIEIR